MDYETAINVGYKFRRTKYMKVNFRRMFTTIFYQAFEVIQLNIMP